MVYSNAANPLFVQTNSIDLNIDRQHWRNATFAVKLDNKKKRLQPSFLSTDVCILAEDVYMRVKGWLGGGGGGGLRSPKPTVLDFSFTSICCKRLRFF